jgi:competence protein ComEC
LGVAGLALWTYALWQPLAPQPRVVFLDVGHGDATFVRSPDGTTLLVDGGDSNNVVDSGQRIVAPFLWSNHVKRLDYVALSHADRDHAGGLFYILHHFPVREFWLSAIPTDRPLERELLDLCARRGVAVRRLHAGEKVDMGGATVEVLHPPSDWPNAEVVNDLSLVLRVTWKGVRILLPGDVETAAETALSRTDCRADILKAPHHGSRTSSSEPLIEAVRPKHCIISTGGTSGREPADEGVLRRYAARGIHIWRTDLLGGIQLTPIGAGIRIESTRKLPGYLSSTEHRIDGA